MVIAAFDSLSEANIDYITLAKGDTQQAAADIDTLYLGKVCERIYGSILQEKTMVITPVSYQTISSKRLAKNFIGLCDNLLPAVKERLIFNVKGIPQNLLNNAQLIACLSTFFRSANSKCRMMQLDSAELCDIDLRNLQVNLVCMTYGTLAPLLRANRPRVERLIGRIHENKTRVLIYDIPPHAKDAMSKQAVDLLSFQESCNK